MPLCGNPECEKEIPEDRTHCDKDCFSRAFELKRLAKGEITLSQEENLWPGQRRRKQTMEIISRMAKEMCPMRHKEFVSRTAYLTGLSPRKVREDYIDVLVDVGILRINEGTLYVMGARDGQ